MPHKDPQAKKEWERLHRPQRLARRRELRRIEAARKAEVSPSQKPGVRFPDQLEALAAEGANIGFVLPSVAGGILAAFNPKLAMGVGGLSLIGAAVFKKGANWWILGAVILALGFLLYWNNRNAEKQHSVRQG